MKKVSFYSDLEKNLEFINNLKTIINDKESNISNCYLSFSNSQKFCLFFETLNSSKHYSFDFYNYFIDPDLDNSYKKEQMIKDFSKFDLDNLSLFLNNFTFDNHYEGQFFASKFFIEKELNPNNLKSIYIKFTPNHRYSNFLIENKKVNKHYIIVKDFYLNSIVKNNSELNEFNSYQFQTYTDPDTAINKMALTILNTTDVFFLVESYKDLETFETYIGKIDKIDKEKLKNNY